MLLKGAVSQPLNYENTGIVLRRKMRKSSLLFFWFIMLAVFIGDTESVSAQEISLPLVNSMEVRGLKRIEEAAVKSKITQKTGEPLSSEKTTNDIKDIYKMGYFDDVKVEIEPLEGGVRVIYLIKRETHDYKYRLSGEQEAGRFRPQRKDNNNGKLHSRYCSDTG